MSQKCWLMIMSEEMVVSTQMATHGFILATLCKYYVSYMEKSENTAVLLQETFTVLWLKIIYD